eukprot:m51a1_g14631 ferric reductase (1061) ;mRNA; f:19649-23783
MRLIAAALLVFSLLSGVSIARDACAVERLPEHAASLGSCNASVAPNATCALACAPGYVAVPGLCSEDAEWAPAPACAAGPCSVATLPHNADGWGNCTGEVASSAQCVLECAAGTTAVPGRCHEQAWSPAPRCQVPIPKPSLPNCAVLNPTPEFYMYWRVDGDRVEFETLALGIAGFTSIGLVNATSVAKIHAAEADLWLTYAPWAQCPDGCVGESTATPHCAVSDAHVDLLNATVVYDPDYALPWKPAGSPRGALYSRYSRRVATGDATDHVINLADGNVVPWAFGLQTVPHANPFHTGGVGTTLVKWAERSWDDRCSLLPPAPAPSSSSTAGSDDDDCRGSRIRGTWEAPGGVVRLEWQVTDDNEAIDFTLTGRTRGWVSFGINSENLMRDADKYTGWVDDTNGSVVLADTYCTGRVIPLPDERFGGRDDARNKSGYQNATHTVLRFRRLLDTGDVYDKRIVRGDVWLLWAVFWRDGTDVAAYEVHGPLAGVDYGGALVNFLTCGPQPVTPSTKIAFLQNPAQAIALTVAAFLALVGAAHWSRRLCRALSASRHRAGAGAGGEMDALLSVNAAGGYGRQCSSLEAARLWAEGALAHRVRKAWPLWALLVAGLYAAVCAGWAAAWVARFSTRADLLESTARAVGHVVSASMLVAVLPAVRNSLLVLLTGEPFERTLLFHRWVGRWTLAALVAHAALFAASRGVVGVVWDGKHVVTAQLYGLLGLAACLVVVATSVERVRRRAFSFFYFAHFAFVPFFVFAALHTRSFVPLCLVALAVWGADRLVRLAWGAVFRRATAARVLAGGEVLLVRWPRSACSRYEAGQYVFVNFPQVSLLEWHPFTLANGPREDVLEVNIKTLGKHTRQMIQEAPARHGGALWVRADGPYGKMMLPVKSYRTVVLIAGGIGVTPMVSLLRDIYGVARADADGGDAQPLLPPSPGRIERVFFHWGVRTADQFDWFADVVDAARGVAAGAGGQRGAVPALDVAVHVDVPFEGRGPEFSLGHMNVRDVLGAASAACAGADVAVCVCGPPPVVHAVWDDVTHLKRRGMRLDLHYESFIF